MLSWIVEYPVSFTLFLVVFFCLFQAWWLKKDFFSPPTVYCFSQCITLGIAYFQLDYAMSDFKPMTWMIWLGAMAGFCGGSFLSKLVAKQKGLPTHIASVTEARDYNWTIHIILSFIPIVLFLIGIYGIVQSIRSNIFA